MIPVGKGKICLLFCLVLLIALHTGMRSGAAQTLQAPGRSQPEAVSADQVSYDEQTGRYVCHGNVRIDLGSRMLLANEAQLTSNLRTIWMQGNARLIESEIIFSGEAIYASLDDSRAFLFGQRCSMKRPGLSISSDAVQYRWDDRLVLFDGHVLMVDGDQEKACTHLEYDLEKNKAS